MRYIVFVSGGNDSLALVQYLFEQGIQTVTVVYSNTGWATATWPDRMGRVQQWVKSLGYTFVELASEGMENLITRKKAFPSNKPKFCTFELKIKPAMIWMDTVDPHKEATCVVGVRREESRARVQWPEWVEASESHGGRDLWSPLVRHTEAMRNALLHRAGWDVLPHRSRECSPCVNSNRQDFRLLPLEDIEKVRRKEKQMGLTMFRPYRHMGARGIDEVLKWAWSERGMYEPPEDCDGGMCGT